MFDTSTAAPALGETLEALQQALDALAHVDHHTASGGERRTALVELSRLATRLDAQRVRLVAVMDRAGDAEVDGAVNLRSWIHDRCRVSRAAAGRDVRAGRRLRALPLLDAAFAAGDISREHVDLTARACTPEREAGFDASQPILADAATRFVPEDYRTVVHSVVEAADPDGANRDAWQQLERRRLYLASTIGAMGVINGTLDPESSEVVHTALEAHMHTDRDAPGDHKRAIWQRRADALVGICRHYLDTAPAHTAKRRRGRPHVSVVVDLAVLDTRGHTDLARRVRADAAHTGRLSRATLERLTCDAHVARVVTDGASQPLDVGRSTRTVPEPIWLALVTRDRHCRHPGCHAPPAQCEAHHIVHWAHGGPTNLDNTILLCWRHHRHHHEGVQRRGLRREPDAAPRPRHTASCTAARISSSGASTSTSTKRWSG